MDPTRQTLPTIITFLQPLAFCFSRSAFPSSFGGSLFWAGGDVHGTYHTWDEWDEYGHIYKRVIYYIIKRVSKHRTLCRISLSLCLKTGNNIGIIQHDSKCTPILLYILYVHFSYWYMGETMSPFFYTFSCTLELEFLFFLHALFILPC